MGKLTDRAAQIKRAQERAACPLCTLEDGMKAKAARADLVQFLAEVRDRKWSEPVAIATLRDAYPDECSKVGGQTIKTHISTHDIDWECAA